MQNFFKEAEGEFEDQDRFFCIIMKMTFTLTHTHRNKCNLWVSYSLAKNGQKLPVETFVPAGLALKLKFQGQPRESCTRSARRPYFGYSCPPR